MNLIQEIEEKRNVIKRKKLFIIFLVGEKEWVGLFFFKIFFMNILIKKFV